MKSSETSIGLFVSSDQYGKNGPEIQTERLRFLTSELGRLGTRISVKKFTECKDGINPNGSVKKESSTYIFPRQAVFSMDLFTADRGDKLPDGTIKEFETYDYDVAKVTGMVEVQYSVESIENARLSITDQLPDSILPGDAVIAINQVFSIDG